jgi:hypothetical protein
MLNRFVMFLISASILGGLWFWLNQSDGYEKRYERLAREHMRDSHGALRSLAGH